MGAACIYSIGRLRFALPFQILSFVLLAAGAALVFGDLRFASDQKPDGFLAAPAAGYLYSDAFALGSVQSNLASGSSPDWRRAAVLFRAAVGRDPASPQHWCELGEALAKSGDLPKAEYSYLRGAALGPHSPDILLDVGDFYFNAGKHRLSLPWFSRLLQTVRDPGSGYVANVFGYYEAMGVRRSGWLDDAIPDGEAARAYLNYLLASKDVRSVADLWDWADGRQFINDDIAIRYSNFLLSRQEMDAAAVLWAKHFSGRGYACVGYGCAFNGDFEHELTGGPFDWRFLGVNGVKTDRDRITRYEGQYSLRLDFSANDNPDFRHFVESVPIHAGRYRLEGFIRIKGITSDEGIRLGISGSGRTQNLRAESPALTGTQSWKRVEAEFDVPDEIHEVQIEVARRKSLRIDNQLTGTAWIDSVRLTRLR